MITRQGPAGFLRNAKSEAVAQKGGSGAFTACFQVNRVWPESGEMYQAWGVPSTWKGYISFGLVSVPIGITPAARSERVSFHQLHKVCHTRLKQPLFCPQCNRIVNRSEVEKGYEYEKGEYVRFEPQELKKTEPQSAEAMEILEFVKLEEIDPIYF